MSINRGTLSRMLLQAAALWKQNTDALSEIDSRFGDGDHGVTIGRIAGLIQTSVESWGDAPMADFIEALGDGIMAIGGGSAGPLYGTLIGGLAEPLGDADEIDGPMLKAMLQASLDAMRDITKAKVGDKTMMDALIPAVEAAQQAGEDPGEILRAACEAAQAGAEASRAFVSKFGRARSYGEQTIGTADAGATSTALLFRGLWEGFAEEG